MFDLKDAPEANALPEISYQKPGIYDNVVISEVVLEQTNANHIPYMRVITQGTNGEQGSGPRMFLSTDVKPGKKTSGWGVTARNLTDWLMATHNVEEAEAKTMITGVASNEALVTKVSALLVGRKFRAKFKGETSQKGNIYAMLAQAESMKVPSESTKLKYSETYDIKPYQSHDGQQSQLNVVGNTNTTETNDGLPF